MRRMGGTGWLNWLALLLALSVGPSMAQAQSNIPSFRLRPAEPEKEPDISIQETNVGILDPAVPLDMMRLRVDLGYNNKRPTRATYFQASNSMPLPETSLDHQDVAAYVEYAVAPWVSTFAEVPYRWINPDVNANTSGVGDSNFGFKVCTWSSDKFIATILLRVYNPTARVSELGTHHWSFEPGLLASWRVMDQLLLEGEFRYWLPLGTGDGYAGEVLRYGVGLSYGQRNASGFWWIPVAEGVGWSILSGQTMVASSPTDFFVQSAANQTIANGYVGVRWGYGKNFESYVGYGRAFTGPAWERDFARVEFRFLY